jgi:hypothetical protein
MVKTITVCITLHNLLETRKEKYNVNWLHQEDSNTNRRRCQARTRRGIHGLPKVSCGPAMPNPYIPCGRAACGCLLPPWIPHAVWAWAMPHRNHRRNRQEPTRKMKRKTASFDKLEKKMLLASYTPFTQCSLLHFNSNSYEIHCFVLNIRIH